MHFLHNILKCLHMIAVHIFAKIPKCRLMTVSALYPLEGNLCPCMVTVAFLKTEIVLMGLSHQLILTHTADGHQLIK